MMARSKHINFIYMLLVMVVVIPSVSTYALESKQEDQQPLQVSIIEILPYVIKDGEHYIGFSIDIWNEVANRLELPFAYVEVASISEQLEAIQQGEVDFGISAINKTSEQEKVLDFSYAYHISGLQIMTSSNAGGAFLSALLKTLLRDLLIIVIGLLLIIAIFANLFWLTERKTNPQIPQDYILGMRESFWYTAVTVTTVGYGDITPHSRLGRVFAIFWMFAGIFVIAGFTASVTSQVTVNRLDSAISDVDDLVDKRVVTVQGTTAESYLTTERISHVVVSDLDQAVEMLSVDEVDAIVHDKSALTYYLTAVDRGQFELAGTPFYLVFHSIAMPKDSPYREEVNIALLEIFEDGTATELYEKWFGVIDQYSVERDF
jgi:ABC-type amino acid transport substrate-binding protein